MRGTLLFVLACACATQQEFTQRDRDVVQQMLRDVSSDVKEHYYDPRLNGIDFDAKVAAATGEIARASSYTGALATVADALDALHDSHTLFLTPPHPYPDYGWELRMIGDRCLIAAIRPGSDAARKGISPGYEVIAVDGFRVTRQTLWRINYVIRHLRPQGAARVDLRSPDGVEGQFDVVAKMTSAGQNGSEVAWDAIRQVQFRPYRQRAQAVRLPDGVAILKLPTFRLPREMIDEMYASAAGAKAMVLDLRGNNGGDAAPVAGLLFGKKVKLADRVERGKTEPMFAEPGAAKPFTGKVAVLVDSASRASAEVLARVVQLEKRGVVVGDRTAGAVRESKNYPHEAGAPQTVSFAASVTDADLIMSDKKSLERVGVVPDVVALPTAADLAAGHDPALSKAVELVGGSIPAAEAGSLFPIEWAN
jgi:carboxyl-terminal processing protease